MTLVLLDLPARIQIHILTSVKDINSVDVLLQEFHCRYLPV